MVEKQNDSMLQGSIASPQHLMQHAAQKRTQNTITLMAGTSSSNFVEEVTPQIFFLLQHIVFPDVRFQVDVYFKWQKPLQNG